MMNATMQKAMIELTQYSRSSIIIGPVGCSQKWFHDIVQYYAKVFVPDERIPFLDPNGALTPGGDRDTMIYLFDNPAKVQKTFVVEPVSVKHLIVRAKK